MSVTIKVFKDGKKISDEMFGGHSVKPVRDYLDNQKIDYRLDKECESASEITANKDLTLMCIDDTNILPYEGSANFITEILMEYEEEVYDEIKRILNSQK